MGDLLTNPGLHFCNSIPIKVYHRMVKILSTGEIVQDDDPRAQQNTPRQRQVNLMLSKKLFFKKLLVETYAKSLM